MSLFIPFCGWHCIVYDLWPTEAQGPKFLHWYLVARSVDEIGRPERRVGLCIPFSAYGGRSMMAIA